MSQLEIQIIEIIKASSDADGISSQDVYDQLIARGMQIPEGAMRQTLDSLRQRGLISGEPVVDRDDVKTNGAYCNLTSP
jgi:repressor of nif and glnA expression